MQRMRVYALFIHENVMNVRDVILHKTKRSVKHPYLCLIIRVARGLS